MSSPVVRTKVIDAARRHRACRTPGRLSAAVTRDLRSQWPALNEITVEAMLADECFARAAEAATYRDAMRAALAMGYRAAQDTREEPLRRAA